MAVSDANNSRIQDYLDGSMPAADRQVFEEDCANDQHLAAELSLFRAIQRELKDHEVNTFRNLIATGIEEQNLHQKGKAKTSPKSDRLTVLFLLVVGLIGVCYYFYSASNKTSSQLEEREQFIPVDTIDHSVPIVAGNSEQDSSVDLLDIKPSIPGDSIPLKKTILQTKKEASAYRQLAMSEFKASTFVFRGPSTTPESADSTKQVFDYFAQASAMTDPSKKQRLLEKVLTLLDNTSVKGNERLLLTRAQAYFETRQYERAIVDFEVLRNSFAYDQNADWGLVLCYLAQMPAQEIAFRQAMDVIISNEDHDFRQKALALEGQIALIGQ